jgi:hypothetical protein
MTIILILNFTIILAFSDSLKVRISDTITANSKNGRIEMIRIQVTVFNYSQNTLILNKQLGVTEGGSLTGDYIPNFCENVDYRGGFRIFLFDKFNSSLVQSPTRSVGDFVYFKKDGKLKYMYLEGIDNPKKIKRALRQYQRLKATSTQLTIESNSNATFTMKIYLGDYQFRQNEIYYMALVYNNKEIAYLSNVCLESNKLTLRVR